MLYKYKLENGKHTLFSDRQLNVLENGAKEKGYEDVLERVEEAKNNPIISKKVFIKDEEIDNLKVDKSKAAIGKEILKICGILIGEVGAIVASSQLGLTIPIPIILLIAAGLTKDRVISMYSIAKKSENNDESMLEEENVHKL